MKNNFNAVAVLVRRDVIERVQLCASWEAAGEVLDAWQQAGDVDGDCYCVRREGPSVKLVEFQRTRVGTRVK